MTAIGSNEEALIQVQYSTGTMITGQSTVVVGIVIDDLYAPNSSATVMYYRNGDTVEYQDVSNYTVEY